MNDCIVVTGAGGFVGRHLVRALALRGERVIAISRKEAQFGDRNIKSVVCKLDDAEQFMPLVARSRVVVHLATTSTPGTSAGQPLAELDGNLRPTLALLQALQACPGTSLLYLSSGGSLYAVDSASSAVETSPVAPRSYHGAAKVAAEHFIRAWNSQFGGSAVLLRPSNLYGPGQVERTGFGIVPAAFGKIARGETLNVWGDGSAVRDYLYIDDFVALCMAVIEAPMVEGVRAYNASSGVGVTLEELFKAMEIASNLPLKRTYDVSRPVDAARIVMNSWRASQSYDWSAATKLQVGLGHTWRWFKSRI